MKRIVCLVIAMATVTAVWGDPRDAQWVKVQQASDKGLPKTAIEHLNPIIESAIKDRAWDEAIRAIGRKVALEGTIQGNKPEEKIVRMKAEIDKAPDKMKPLMQAIIAHWYWHYFQHNRWRFMQRTRTAEAPGAGADFTTWDLPRLFAEVDKQFGKALAAKDWLCDIPVSDFTMVLEKGAMPDAYRPTLYDFVAHEALKFYSAGEQAGARAQDAFDLSAETPIFSNAAEFLRWNIATTDKESPTYKALLLYQDLMRFHEKDRDPAAFLDADLERYVFGKNKAFGPEKDERFKAAMKRWAEEHADHRISSRALYQWASVLHAEGDYGAAHKIATQGLNRFPDSPGGALCYNLLGQIEAKSASASVERVWNKPWPKIAVTYRNVDKVWFRIVQLDWTQRLRFSTRHPEQLDYNERSNLLKLKPVHAWSVDLPPTADFKERVESAPAPDHLEPGFYYIIASFDRNFAQSQNQVAYSSFWVSDLALVMRTISGEAQIGGFVLNAMTGEPLPGANILSWEQGIKRWQFYKKLKTDENGLFQFDTPSDKNLILQAEHNGLKLGSAGSYRLYDSNNKPRPFGRTVFFTDRSLYRPGQTIQYKGICIHVDQNKDNYEVLPGEKVNVVFYDVNGKEIARNQHRANDYGSFNGSFTAPRDRLMGRMRIQAQDRADGHSWFNVEEYKRPKFQVSLELPEEAARLNKPVTVKGRATAYTGAAIDGAKLRWRVVRNVQYPPWWGWCFWWRQPVGQSQEIAHGQGMTKADGSFEVTFNALPDKSVEQKDEPTFTYSIHADVTDASGETRSAQQTVRAGYTALKASLSAANWQTAAEMVAISVRTTTLDNKGQAAQGTVTVHMLKQPHKVARAQLAQNRYRYYYWGAISTPPKPDPSNIDSWELGEAIETRTFKTDENGSATLEFELGQGPFRAVLKTQDRFGKPVTALLPLRVLDPEAEKLTIKVPQLFDAPQWSIEPGNAFMALWGSGYDRARAFVEIEHRGEILKSYWTAPERTQTKIVQQVGEAMRGGFTVRLTQVRENRAYIESRKVYVPWSNKNLSLRWEHFTSKLEPGKKEMWTAVVTGPDAGRAVAEVAAGMYDASLDAYLPHNWAGQFGVFRQDYSRLHSTFENNWMNFQHIYGGWSVRSRRVDMSYRHYPPEVIGNFFGYMFGQHSSDKGRIMSSAMVTPQESLFFGMQTDAAPPVSRMAKKSEAHGGALRENENKYDDTAPADESNPNLDKVTARKNMNETAFFFPHLITENGEVKIEFTMPEALTEWKFFGFAHDKDLRAGLISAVAVTSKDLMVQPNPPRFLREGDRIEFTVKISNLSDRQQNGKVRLSFSDAISGKNVDQALGIEVTDQPFDVPAKESRTYSWKIAVPDDMGFLTYKTVGATDKLSDGEEGCLPVLPRRVLVQESLPLPIRDKTTKKFSFKKLLESEGSDTIHHKSLVVQMVSQPAWYAVMALPYLMEYPHQCAEQRFNRLYANLLAQHIANADPKIRRVFDVWKNTPGDTLDSPMEKNQDLKMVMIEETPWMRQAAKESQARRNVGILFDENRLTQESKRAMDQLITLQREDGGWPWFPGGRVNSYITLYITTGFGRLRHLGVDVDIKPAVKALNHLDHWIDNVYDHIVNKEQNHLTPTIALYLYGRSFFLKDRPIPAASKEAVFYFLRQGRTYWLDMANRQSQAHLAVAMLRFGEKDTARDIMRSIKERSVNDEELGMFWRELELSWWWYRAPIETQAMMIEAFDEVMQDQEAVKACKVWLLKQKQTQDWKTTKATADAIYALLLRGANWLASDALVEVALAGKTIEPEKVEAGTGFYEERFSGAEVEPAMGEITVKKVDEGVSWGSVHWQYMEEIGKVTAHTATPLKLTKSLYTKVFTKKGPELQPVKDEVSVGDELVVRVVVNVDRDMEYVHLKDYRGSGTEPVNVISRYKMQDGLYYYETTRDTASHFFIDYLPKGVYVFEYAVRVQLKGVYQTGFAAIQCMYAPEFNSHSQSIELKVK